MDRLTRYRSIVKRILAEHAEQIPNEAAPQTDELYWRQVSGMKNLTQMQRLLHFKTSSHGSIETLPLFDDSHGNYAVLDLGWDRMGRVHAVILHVRLKNGKVWVEQDGTEDGVAEELVAAGVPKEDIVLAFYRPERRAITEFAVA